MAELAVAYGTGPLAVYCFKTALPPDNAANGSRSERPNDVVVRHESRPDSYSGCLSAAQFASISDLVCLLAEMVIPLPLPVLYIVISNRPCRGSASKTVFARRQE